ncbi:putative beta-lysine N-acetyltransferase [Bacillus sp. RG28]|uniref:Beta-lysine N-acetyltransferase n=1 Tax=Gottfriedia endophytica TaxID=2820819 RepID=A0A940NRI1_9BACI|nr:putative beta-lysine N-acetyltransferase [Gottfriedia endophytica]MBP0726450.1 putative beta-lysine N-acetyltransferase [Gottfriedia endophytica]
MSNEFYESKIIQTEEFYADACFDYFNKRIRVDDYRGNIRSLLHDIENISETKDFTKLIIKVKHSDKETMFKYGYVLESSIPGYFQGSPMYFYSKFRDYERRNSQFWIEEDTIIKNIIEKPVASDNRVLDSNYQMRIATKEDAIELANLYKVVFEIYPTPLDDSEYVKQSIDEDVIYYVIEHEGKVVSAAAAELNVKQCNAELTNCATLPSYRKHGWMKLLLRELEKELVKRSIYCSYTIARSLSYGMNAAFYQLGYEYTGRMANNCYIFDKIEDMNVWVKDLAK